jgi:molybdenum cofactor cytidylyltransferase
VTSKKGEQSSAVSAVLLAAGTSSRMGTPKQLLRFGNETLLEHAIGILSRSKVDEIIVVLGHQAVSIQSQIRLENVKVVVNDRYGEGMGTSLRTGISSVSPDARAALVMLADQPFLLPATIDRLIEEYDKAAPQIVLPLCKGFRGNPVLLDRSVFPEIMGLAGDVGCRAIFGDHTENILKVPVEDIGVLLDVDTKTDLERVEQVNAGETSVQELLRSPEIEDREVGAASPVFPTQPELVVVGQEAVGLALVRLAKAMKFTVTVVDPLIAIDDVPGVDRVLHTLDFSQLPGTSETYVVTASRGRFDEEAIEEALRTSVAYVALVANKRRAQEILKSLRTRGISQDKLRSLHAPAGIDIGAEGPEEIALSILAEIVADRHRRAIAQKAMAD